MFLSPTKPVLLLCLAIWWGCCPKDAALALACAPVSLSPSRSSLDVRFPPTPPEDLNLPREDWAVVARKNRHKAEELRDTDGLF